MAYTKEGKVERLIVRYTDAVVDRYIAHRKAARNPSEANAKAAQETHQRYSMLRSTLFRVLSKTTEDLG